ncbi:MAG: hypothetical protein KDH20_01015 [Rhodocyclaceae bacterium]|nr:hypothetical protein [Rhodocyclaceae bacterium]
MIRTLLQTIAALALLAILALATNPSPETHRETISQALSSRSELASLLRLGRVTAFFSEYYSVGVASYTKVGERTVSVGAFGYVHVLDPEPPAGAR